MIVDQTEENAMVCLFFVVVVSLSAPTGLHSVVTNLLTSQKFGIPLRLATRRRLRREGKGRWEEGTRRTRWSRRRECEGLN